MATGRMQKHRYSTEVKITVIRGLVSGSNPDPATRNHKGLREIVSPFL
jgi:hypothetical protein